ncbi:major facilitator superfamily domain-containing protein 6 [Tribolium castaneum]|uniref:Major facilitator superfamily domain-containing protein 6-like Protein n=1 Tax=Tribolium castaneum TaxID=7070 RepID=D6WGI7_TRICA|nr:PREDICTED: major facilitator superfamily domain-containing protein 6 [Tribolium castaneum]EFA00564.1 Major facilitator superfamily domain-containing protein 6-like Protein [Tribolium castaneum]|eukprot:XP_970503.2 PREDICTED: major facilitator superfamily domain-containing protein 6 [Tribolium castaneum]
MLDRVNKDLLPMKAHYFLFNAGTGPVQPFLSTYARQLGFSATIVGLIYTILPISGMLAKPIVGAIADRFRCQKLMFLAAQLLTAAAFLAINFSPEIPKDQKVHFACDGDAVFDTSPLTKVEIDDCLVDQFQKTPGNVTCRMNCPMEEQFWKVVVQYWNATEYQNYHPDNFEFTAFVIREKTIRINNATYFGFKYVELDSGKTTKALCPCGKECHISTVCDITCDDYTLNSMVTQTAVSDEDVYSKSQFWIFLILMIFGWVGQAVVVSVGDAICFQLLGDKPNRYGYQRLFGALGWGIFSVIAGLMVDSLSEGSSKKNFESAFYLSFAFLLLDFAVSSNLKNAQTKQSTSILKDVGRLLVEFRIVVFLVWCIAVGMCTALMWQFLFFLIEDLAKNQGCDSQEWIKTLEGIVQAIQTLAGEMPFFFWSGKILKRIGHINAMSLVLLVIGIRFILYSVITNPWWFLPIEFLNGLTFGLFYACMTSYASVAAPPGTEATMQGLVGAIFEGVGVSLGSFVGGLIYDAYSGPWTFRLFGIGALITCLLHAGVQFLIKRSDYEARYTSPSEAFSALYDDQQEMTLVE